MMHFSKRAAAAVLFLMSASAASAADLNRPVSPAPQPYSAPIVAYGFSWTGAYVGANLGGNFVHMGLPGYVGSDANTDSFAGGIQAGYLWQVSQFVYGIEGDIGYGRNRKTTSYIAGDSFSQRDTVDWNMSARGRIGYALDRLLIYGTGGITFANTKSKVWDNTLGTEVGSSDRLRPGWILGAGLEYAVTNNVSVRGEYLHSDYGHYNAANQRRSLDVDMVRLGVNYKF